MAFGADLHAVYQREIDWPKVATSDLEFFWVQLSRGGGPLRRTVDGVLLTPDAQCDGVHTIGRKLGGYHFATMAPSPERQAAFLAAEVRRQGAFGLPPALDLEAEFNEQTLPESRVFAQRFIRAMAQQGFPRIALYSNAYFLSKLAPQNFDVDDLVIWAADYGTTEQVRFYPGPVHVRQFTKTGHVEGITGYVDLNRSDLAFLDVVEPDPARVAADRVVGWLNAGRAADSPS